MAEERTPRSADDRKVTSRKSDHWTPAARLPTPDPVDGWVFRWIRTQMMGAADNPNVSRRMREGWVACKAEDHPELMVRSDIDSRWEGNIEIGGQLLCKAPAEDVAKRREYYDRLAEHQMDSVDHNYMRENDPRMPLLKPERHTTRNSFGK